MSTAPAANLSDEPPSQAYSSSCVTRNDTQREDSVRVMFVGRGEGQSTPASSSELN
jgi:hypothetical protein